MRRACLVPLVFALAGSVLVSAAPVQAQKSLFSRLHAAYAAGDWEAVARAPRPPGQFPSSEIKAAVARWRKDWQPVNAAFLLELSWRWSPSLMDDSRALVMDRPTPLGRDARADAFELAWHKTAMSYLEGQRNTGGPDPSEVAALAMRMTAAHATPGDPRIEDSWVELTFGIIEEQRTLSVPTSLAKVGASAIEHFDKAIEFDATRPEALVRKASLLVRLNRPEEALTTLVALRTDDRTLRYWSHLFRGRALEALGRPDDAVRAYADALEVVPHAQSPAVMLTSLEMRRGQAAAAERWAGAGWAPANAADPWWQYDAGEYRLFQARLAALRALVRP